MIEKKKKKIQQHEEIIAKHEQLLGELEELRDEKLETARRIHFTVEQDRNPRGDESPDGEEGDGGIRNEPTQEDLLSIEPKFMNKKKDYYLEKMNNARKKIEAERKRRQLTNEDPHVARERFLRAKETLGKNL